MPAIGSVKLKTFVPVGGVSKREMVSVAFPPPPQFTVQAVFTPLQEVRRKTAEIPKRKKVRFEFMQTPHAKFRRRIGRERWPGNPRTEY